MKFFRLCWSILIVLSVGACQSGLVEPMLTSTFTPTNAPTETTTPTFRELAEEHLALGTDYYQGREWDLAIDEFDEAISIDAMFAEAYLGRAMAYYALHDTEAATADINKALELEIDPQTPDLYVKRGRALSILDDLNAAIEDFNMAIELDPDHIEAYVRRGNIYWEQGEVERAMLDFEKAIDLDPDYALVYQKRGLVYRDQGEYAKALEDFDLAIELDPEDALNYYFRGYENLRAGDQDKAMADFDEATKLDPLDSWSFFFKGLIFAQQDNLVRGLIEMNEAARLDPDEAVFQYYLGLMYADTSDPEQAILHLEKSLELGLGADEEEYARALLDDLKNPQIYELEEDWLVNADELNTFSEYVGISDWNQVDQAVLDDRVCRVFSGISWSASNNTGVNCIFGIDSEATSEDVVAKIYNEAILPPEAILVPEVQLYEGGFALFIHTGENGHTVVDAFLRRVDLLYWASVSVGTPLESTTEDYYQENREPIDAFLVNVIDRNLERAQRLSPELAALIPDLEIPEGLFDPEAGESNFDHAGLGSQGDWIIYASAEKAIPPVAIVPIPSGWTTEETDIQTNIYFSPSGVPEAPAIHVSLFAGFGVDSSEVLNRFVSAVNNERNEILATEVIDENKGYTVVFVTTRSGEKRYLLQLFSRLESGEGGFYAFSVYTQPDVWEDYYPIIRAMVENWVTEDYLPLKIDLPETLIE